MSKRSQSTAPPVFEIGVVAELDPAKGKARVNLPSRDGVLTWWLDVLQRGSLAVQSYWMPRVGQQVRILADEKLESGCILGAIYSTADPPPVATERKHHVTFGDDCVIEYDDEAGVFEMAFASGDRITFDRDSGVLRFEVERLEIVGRSESWINSAAKAIAVVGAPDSDGESDGSDVLTGSGQF